MSAKKRVRVFAFLWLAAIAATVVVWLALDTIACPDGYVTGSAEMVRTGGTKRHIELDCVNASGNVVDGSMALVILSWVGVFLVVWIGGYKVSKKLAPIQ